VSLLAELLMDLADRCFQMQLLVYVSASL
jgi:hypothetical protein